MSSAATPSATPRISVNKLGEFLVTSSPTRRRTIVRQQKNPPPAIVPRYRQALAPIEAYLTSGGENVDAILDAIVELRERPPQSDWQRDDNNNTADALEHFLDSCERLPLEGVTYLRGDNEQPRLLISGVVVSVRPDFLLQFNRRNRDMVGALKIHFIRGDDKALGSQGQEYVSTLCHQWLHENHGEVREPCRRHCFSLDTFRTAVVPAPTAFTRRMTDIQAACNEIALLWPHV